jgi:putative transposase
MGVADRLILSDAQWCRISEHIIGDERSCGSSGRDNRMFVEAVLWIVRTGSPWRDLPEAFGPWNSAFRRFSRWSAKGVWHLIVDSTIIRAHQHAAGAKKGLAIRPLAAPAAA